MRGGLIPVMQTQAPSPQRSREVPWVDPSGLPGEGRARLCPPGRCTARLMSRPSMGGLHQLDPQIRDGRQFGRGLDALGDDRDVQFATDMHPILRDGRTQAVRVEAARPRHVELDDVGLEVGEQLQSRVAGAEVVDCRVEAALLGLGEDPLEMGFFRDPLALGDIEDDAVNRKVEKLRRFKGGADPGLWLVDGTRQEVDVKEAAGMLLKPELRGERDRTDATGLVDLGAADPAPPGPRPLPPCGRMAWPAGFTRAALEGAAARPCMGSVQPRPGARLEAAS